VCFLIFQPRATIYFFTIPSLAAILKHPIKDVKLFKNNKELIERKEPPPKKPEKGGSRGGSSRAASSKGSKGGSKKGKKGKKGKSKSKDGKTKKDEKDEPIIFTVGDYGYNPRTASVLKPGTMSFTVRYIQISYCPIVHHQRIPPYSTNTSSLHIFCLFPYTEILKLVNSRK